MNRPLAALDVDLQELMRRMAADRFAARMAPLAGLLAHPEAAIGKPASPGEAAEQRHLLYDADADASTPAFPYPTAVKETTL